VQKAYDISKFIVLLHGQGGLNPADIFRTKEELIFRNIVQSSLIMNGHLLKPGRQL